MYSNPERSPRIGSLCFCVLQVPFLTLSSSSDWSSARWTRFETYLGCRLQDEDSSGEIPGEETRIGTCETSRALMFRWFLANGFDGHCMMVHRAVGDSSSRQIMLLLLDPISMHPRPSLRANSSSKIIIFPTDPADQPGTSRIPRSQRFVVKVRHSLIQIVL